MSFKDLKQYIEKELHTRRFLQEGFDLLTEIENINTQKSELSAEVNSLIKKQRMLEAGVAELQTAVTAANHSISSAKTEADVILKQAVVTAAAVEAKAKEQSAALLSKANDEATSVQVKIADRKKELKDIENKISILRTEVSEILAEKDRLLKKYAH